MAALTNRGGVPWKEGMFFDPCKYGQCCKGILMYAGERDQLLECTLTSEGASVFVPSAILVIDAHVYFHGQIVLEFFLGGLVWGSPAARQFSQTLRSSLT